VAENMIRTLDAFIKYIRIEIGSISIAVVFLWKRTGSRRTACFELTRLQFSRKLNKVKADDIIKISKRTGSHHIREDCVHLTEKGLSMVKKELKSALSK
jgi:hypothetical protein